MLANYERIFEEIQKEAEQAAPANAPVEELVTLVMSIVDEVDQHRLKPKSINKEIQNLLLNFVNKHGGELE